MADEMTKESETAFASGKAIARFINTLKAHFTSPVPPLREWELKDKLAVASHAEKEALWFASMARALRGYPEAVLVDGADEILRRMRGTDRRFPLPGQIIDVLGGVAEERNRKPIVEIIENQRAYPYSRERTRLVVDMLRGSQIGLDAVNGNWVGPLVSFCRENSRMPKDHECGPLIARSREFDDLRGMAHAGVGWPSVRAGNHPLAVACAKFADTIEIQNQLWARVIRGEESDEALFRPLDMAKTGT